MAQDYCGVRFFVKGPISWEWCKAAMRLGGKTSDVGLLLWFLAGLQRSRRVTIWYGALVGTGLTRQVVYRAMQRLVKAGLVLREKKHWGCLEAVLVPPDSEGGWYAKYVKVEQAVARTRIKLVPKIRR